MQTLVEFLIYQPWWALYSILFGILILCGLGVPIPEDLTLFTMGYCAYNGLADVLPGILVCMAGVLVGDSTIYILGRKYGPRLAQSRPFNRFLTDERLKKTSTYLKRYGNKLIFAARFMPGLRAPIYFTVGTLHLPFPLFFGFDFLASLISVPLLVYSAYFFGDKVDFVIHKAHQVQWVIFGALLLGILFYIYKNFRKKRLM